MPSEIFPDWLLLHTKAALCRLYAFSSDSNMLRLCFEDVIPAKRVLYFFNTDQFRF
jgi:hypothetical protein